jgi:hypothetical protein
METLSCLQSIDHPDEIPSLLRSVMGENARLVDCRVINQDLDYCVLFARLSHPDIEVMLKLAGPKARMAGQFDRTAAIHQLVAQRTTTMRGEGRWPWRYLIRPICQAPNGFTARPDECVRAGRSVSAMVIRSIALGLLLPWRALIWPGGNPDPCRLH